MMEIEKTAYLEIAHHPIGIGKEWSQAELLDAARKSVCRNTGWPIGIVLTNPDAAPKPMRDGIRAMIRPVFREGSDSWSLDKRGYFYFIRELEEDFDDRTGGKRSLYFDTRIWRIAEGLLHCANLYRSLAVPTETEIRVQIAHHGLEGRTLLAANPVRFMMHGRTSHENEIHWAKTLPLGTIEPSIEDLVGAIAGQLFMLYEFWQPQVEFWKVVLQKFLKSRV